MSRALASLARVATVGLPVPRRISDTWLLIRHDAPRVDTASGACDPAPHALRSVRKEHCLRSFSTAPSGSGSADTAITISGSGYGSFRVVAPAEFAKDDSVPWTTVPITPYNWIMKYDNILPVDMDSDGDTDLVISEETEGLLLQGAGVLWCENRSCEYSVPLSWCDRKAG